MTQLLISDTSVLIDLGRCGCREAVFALAGFSFAVPDLLYVRELEAYEGPALMRLGLRVIPLTDQQLTRASKHQEQAKAISLPDAAALVLAKEKGLILLTGDGPLRALAQAEDVLLHGVLWVLDQMEKQGVVAAAHLFAGLSALKAHPRCRLPQSSVNERLLRWRQAA